MRLGPHTETSKITNRHYEAISCARSRAMIASTRRGLSIQQADTAHQHKAGCHDMILQTIKRPARCRQPRCRPQSGHLGKSNAASLAGGTIQPHTRRTDRLAAVIARRCRAQFLLGARVRCRAVGMRCRCGNRSKRKANECERSDNRDAAYAHRSREIPYAPVHAPHTLPYRPS